jgi:hypothetical protein
VGRLAEVFVEQVDEPGRRVAVYDQRDVAGGDAVHERRGGGEHHVGVAHHEALYRPAEERERQPVVVPEGGHPVEGAEPQVGVGELGVGRRGIVQGGVERGVQNAQCRLSATRSAPAALRQVVVRRGDPHHTAVVVSWGLRAPASRAASTVNATAFSPQRGQGRSRESAQRATGGSVRSVRGRAASRRAGSR